MKRRVANTLRVSILVILMMVLLRPCNRTIGYKMTEEAEGFSGKHLRCAIALGRGLQESLKYGLNYELLQDFGAAEGCEIEIVTVDDSTNYTDSLREGVFDIVATRIGRDSLDFDGIDFSWSFDGSHAMAVSSEKYHGLRELNNRLVFLVNSGDYDELERMFKVGYNPFKLVENGTTVKRLSPYDASIKKYAKTLGWDWRMLAALIYKESKFTINNVSSRGAVGLMQVRPTTAARYGVEDLLDPEENIKAGTTNIKKIQDNYFSDEGFTIEEKEKFTLAAYNAGVGRIADCRRLAASMGKNNQKWDDVVSVIPFMKDEYLDSTDVVQYGPFQGHETIAYVASVKEIYDAFCTICPYTK